MNKNDMAENEAEFSQYLQPIWARKWFVLALVTVVTLATYLYTDRQAREYTASTQIFLQNGQLDRLLFGADQVSRDDRTVANQAKLLETTQVAKRVGDRLGLQQSPRSILASVNATPNTGSDFVTITAVQRTPQLAADIANGFARAFLEIRTGDVRDQSREALRLAQRQLDALPRGEQTEDERADLQGQIRRLGIILSLPNSAAEQVEPAVAPGAASAPKPKRSALFAFVLSLFLGALLCHLLDRLDRRLRDPEHVSDAYQQPSVALLPHEDPKEAQSTVPARLKEPFRMLRANVQLARLEGPVRSLVVTSAVSGEGKSTVVRNLGLTYRDAGLRVAILEADLRRPTMAKAFGLEPQPGLTNVLTGTVSLDDAIQEVVADAHGEGNGLPAVHANGKGNGNGNGHGPSARPRLDVLVSGPEPANPPAVLSAAPVKDLIEELKERYDIVLIDSPPLLAVSDAVPLLSLADGMLLVARLRWTTRDAVRGVREQLDRVPHADLLGVVTNDLVESRGDGGGYYAYGYSATS